jgi:hypothetical protein
VSGLPGELELFGTDMESIMLSKMGGRVEIMIDGAGPFLYAVTGLRTEYDAPFPSATPGPKRVYVVLAPIPPSQHVLGEGPRT